ncbi:MAG: hypothetical protein K1060chlam1_01133 [Candidatus Anoxychlamydiales bacterium]|nr:hypothetical protein [Candidatus Anoxychlamydiales bacterium]
MALVKQKFREIVFQMLFSNIFVESDEKLIVPFIMKKIKTTKKNTLFALDYVNKIVSNVKEIDIMIKKVSTAYEIERICKVEITILRLALYEMLFDENIPCKVAISEAIRLTKKFASVKSASFINAILDAIFQKNESTKK